MMDIKYMQNILNRSASLILVFSFLIAGCNMDRIPKGFPDKKEFAEIIAEVHFADAVVTEKGLKKKGFDDVTNGYYHDVLAKYNLTENQFDSIVSWYSAHPKLYQEVYEDAVTILTERETKWQHEVRGVKEEMERMEKLREERNIWTGNKKLILVNFEDSGDRRLPFDMDVDTIEESGYRISAYYQELKGNMAKELMLEVIAMYADSSYDTISYEIPASFRSEKVELNIGREDSLRILRLQGFLLKHDTNEMIKAKIKDVEFEYIPMLDSLMEE
jgi:hypothetical protein